MIPYPIWMKFCRVADIPDVITPVNFGDDRLRDLVAEGGGQIGKFAPFPIGFCRRPYSTLVLPCECCHDSAEARNAAGIIALIPKPCMLTTCLLYTSDAADE